MVLFNNTGFDEIIIIELSKNKTFGIRITFGNTLKFLILVTNLIATVLSQSSVIEIFPKSPSFTVNKINKIKLNLKY